MSDPVFGIIYLLKMVDMVQKWKCIYPPFTFKNIV